MLYCLVVLLCVLVFMVAACFAMKKCGRGPANDEGQDRAVRYLHPAFQWKLKKEKELKDICVPFKFSRDKLEFDEQTSCAVC